METTATTTKHCTKCGSDPENWKHTRAAIYANMIQVAIEEYQKSLL